MCISRTVGIFQLSGRGIGISKTGVDSYQRFGVEQTAETNEFVEAEVVVLNACPGGIFAGRPAVTCTDSVAPVVAADEVAAGPSIHRGVEFLEQFHRIGAHTFDVVRRHKGDRTHETCSHCYIGDFDLQLSF